MSDEGTVPGGERAALVDFEALARLPGDVVAVIRPDGTALWVSPSVERTLGYSRQQYLELADLDLIHPDDRDEVVRRWTEMLAAPGNELRAEARVLTADGTWRWIDAIVTNHLDDPAVGALVANYRDIHERRVAEEALAASEERFRALVHASAEVMVVTDAEGVITYCSPTAWRLFGREADQLVGTSPLDLVHPEDLDRLYDELAGAFAGHDDEGVGLARIHHGDGSWRWAEITVRNLLDDAFVAGLVVNVRDVDDRKRAEDALRSSEERLLAVLHHSRDVVCLLDLLGQVTWVSPAVRDMLGWSEEDLVGTSVFLYAHQEDLGGALDRVASTLEGARPADPITLRLRRADGTWLPVEVAGTLLHDEAGEVQGVILSMRDVAWRMEAEESLRRSEERFRAMVQESSDVVMVADQLGVITWVSPAIRHVLGHEPDALLGTNGADIAHPDDLEYLIETFAPVFLTPGATAVAVARARHASGEWRWVEESATNLLDDDRVSGVVLHFRDITERLAAEEARRAGDARFRTIAQSSPIGIFQQDVDGGCVYVNERWQEITGLSFDEAMGDGWKQSVHPDDAERLGVNAPSTGQGAEPYEVEYRVVRPGGEVRWVSARIGAVVGEQGDVEAWVGTVEDVTERFEAQRDTARLTDIFEATHDLVGIADRRGDMLYFNRSARHFFGLPDHGDLAVNLADVFTAEVMSTLTQEILPRLVVDGMWSGELAVRRADGVVVPTLVQLLVHNDDEGRFEFFSGVMHDISERKDFEHQLAHQATHDPLTGLPNRILLLERLEQALERARRHRSRVAVLFLDLDHFKVVNDSLGHELGDRLLVAIAERLRVALRPSDTVARFGGDEFVVLCEDLLSPSDAVAIAQRVNEAISGAFEVGDSEVFVGVSIGIAFPDDAQVEPSTLIRDADAAMYRAKARGRARWEVFDNAMRASAIDRLDIESALRRAIERRELRVHYQPIVALDTGTIRGVEALLRWEHPERGLLAPGEFITVAEETGLIVPIGAWVLDAACRQVHRWQASVPGSQSLSLSVNLSGRQLSHPSLVDDIARVLEETSIDPSRLELEITESVLMDDVEASQETLTALRRLGVRLGIDDFGTGYSSMSYLRRFPVDVLKVDRSFVDGLGADPSDSAIVAAIVTLAHTLGLRAVAEGVETPEHLAELRRLGCDFGQGYLMARPLSGEALAQLLATDPRW